MASNLTGLVLGTYPTDDNWTLIHVVIRDPTLFDQSQYSLEAYYVRGIPLISNGQEIQFKRAFGMKTIPFCQESGFKIEDITYTVTSQYGDLVQKINLC